MEQRTTRDLVKCGALCRSPRKWRHRWLLRILPRRLTGWVPQGYLPDDKTQRSKLVRYYFEPQENGIPVSGNILLSLKKPISIRIFGDIAVVHYTQEDLITRDGKEKIWRREAWTDILKKEGGLWVMIADHGHNFGAETGGQ